MDTDQYCREVESHLCRKNDGHLIRIAGPSFELVRGWATQGIPLNVVRRGIDRCVERHEARGPRRRPVRIDFCEADVLETFDEWRRAVGIFQHQSAAGQDVDAEGARKGKSGRGSLAGHIDRVVGRLVARRTDPGAPERNDEIARAIRLLDEMRDKAPKARGEARAKVIEDLAALDRALTMVMRRTCPADVRDALTREAEAELEPFRPRMTAEVYQQAIDSAIERILRDQLGLPQVAYE